MKSVIWKWYCHKKGYTLIELIFSISIFVLLVLALSSLLKLSFKTLDFTYTNRRIDNNNFYTLKYIENEIRKADYYYESSKSNLGIIIVYENSKGKLKNKAKEEYEHIIFNYENNKLIRNTVKTEKLYKLNNERYESHNILLSDLDKFNSKVRGRNLEISIKKENYYLKKNIALRAKKI